MAKARAGVPAGHHTVTPQLIMNNAASAIDWYKKALGAEEVARAPGPDGKIMHAEIRIGNSLIMLNDEMGGGRSPKAIGGSPASLWVYVEDCDALFNRAVAAGAKVPPGRWAPWPISSGAIAPGRSPIRRGMSWTIATHKEDLTPEELDQRAEDFFKNVAGLAAVVRTGPPGRPPARPAYRASSA